MGTKQERVSEFGDRSKGIIQYKQPKEKKKVGQSLRTLGSLTKGLTFMSLEFERKESEVMQTYLRKHWLKTSQFL